MGETEDDQDFANPQQNFPEKHAETEITDWHKQANKLVRWNVFWVYIGGAKLILVHLKIKHCKIIAWIFF